MSTQTTLAIAAMLLSIASVIVSGLFSARTTRISHELEATRERQLEEKTALQAASRVYEPLAQAAAELQSRIYNIVKTGWVPLTERYSSHGDYVVTSTAFLFAHYFGWIEARRQAVLSSSGEGRRDAEVSAAINQVRQILRQSEFNEGFMFFHAEQRAIGELMFSWDERAAEAGDRIPQVAGYATFLGKYREDPHFREWFGPIDRGLDQVASGGQARLIEIHAALIDLIAVLDPTRKYTTRYDLRPIDSE